MTWTIRQRSKFANLAAIAEGTGSQVLLIHGVGLRAEAWNAQIDALSKRHRVVAVDMPGHGESPVPTDTLKLAQYTDAIAEGISEPTIVVGHSMGAMIALDLAVRYPDHIKGVAALNAIFEREDVATNAVRARADSLDGISVSDPEPTLQRWFASSPSAERTACFNWLSSVNPVGYQMAYRSFAYNDGPVRENLAKLKCPALFMTGSKEPNSTPEMSTAMAEIAPQGEAIIAQNAAHMMPMTHVDEVNAAL
ncbi:MAG: alpha/beta hydrolase, partial [Paracoccaceae bacterium]|nr:alpha/beta hydrolase [Paracoccaceae bacterium]